MQNQTDTIMEIIERSQRDQSTKVSMFVPLRADVGPASIYRSLRKVAAKLGEGSDLSLTSDLPIGWEDWKSRQVQTLAIYETNNEFLIVPLNVPMQPRVVVANSFHIKPLLLQEDYSLHALVLHFHQGGASLLKVGTNDYEILERYIPSSYKLDPNWPYQLDRGKVRQFMHFIRDDLKHDLTKSTAFIGVSSNEHSVFQLSAFWERLGRPILLLDDSFSREFPHHSLEIVRMRLKRLIDRRQIDKVSSSQAQTVESNLKAAIEKTLQKIKNREIKQLCISLEDIQFGHFSVDKDLSIHRTQLNNRDDDLLDDLAEHAISSGVTVHVVPKKFMPSGHKILVS